MLYLLFGEDDFSLREVLEEIKGGLGGEELLAYNTTVLDGKHLTLNQLMNACSVVPFLASKRLVIVTGLLGRFEQQGSGARPGRRPVASDVGDWQALKGYVTGMPPSTVLALVDGKIRRDNPLLRSLATQAVVREFPLLRGNRLHDWIGARVKKAGGDISPSAVRLLADLIGGNLWVMSSEIEKLCLYSQGRRIEEGDVMRVVSYSRESNVFAVIDALMRGQTSAAATLLHRLLDEGAAPPYLLFMITRQFRLLVQAKELSSQRLPASQIATRLGLGSDYAVRKILEQSRGYSMERLEAAYRSLLDTDISIKTGRFGSELALDLLVVELCQGR